MTAQTEKARLVQLVKIGQKQLGMDDESYRQMLVRLTNKNSATKLTVVELHKVLHELKQKGAKITIFTRKRNPNGYSPATGEVKVKSQITHKIRAVWIEMGKDGLLRDSSEQALNAYVRKMVNPQRTTLVLNVSALRGDEAGKILEILKKWHMRVLIERIEAKTGEKINTKISYDHAVEYYREVMSETL